MKVTFYGTRGSIPVAESDFLQFGGNTACIFLSFDNGRVAILDAGTGIRKLGEDLIHKSIAQYDNIFIGLSQCSPLAQVGCFWCEDSEAFFVSLILIGGVFVNTPLRRDSESIRKLALVTICSPSCAPLARAISLSA